MMTINRPTKAGKPTGLLGFDKFQIAYVTNDLDRAIETFSERYRIEHWTVLDAGVMRIALAWTNGQQIELIHTSNEYQPLYDDWIEKDGEFVIRHHHFGYFVYDDDEWALLRAHLEEHGQPLAMDADTEMMTVIYVYAPDLGHFLEYLYPNEKGKAFFESVASN